MQTENEELTHHAMVQSSQVTKISRAFDQTTMEEIIKIFSHTWKVQLSVFFINGKIKSGSFFLGGLVRSSSSVSWLADCGWLKGWFLQKNINLRN